ncbi:hypothetical protein [Agrobacterium pusense]|uniref:hypothetical protein n=1 Tax=Agrobacterium pusense TaxID=648995 RepID=UPI002F41294C
MGVIEWREKPTYDDLGVMWHGYLGDDCICFVADYGPDYWLDDDGIGGWTLFVHQEFPGHLHAEGHRPCDDLEHGKAMAEAWLLEWMSDVGMVSKAEFDYANEAYSCLHSMYLARLDQALELAKDRALLKAEVDRLERVLKKIRREIGRESNRDIYCALHVIREFDTRYVPSLEEIEREVVAGLKVIGEAA